MVDLPLRASPRSWALYLRDLMPHRPPDLFDGDQLVLLGQYIGNDPLTFVLEGNYLGARRVEPAINARGLPWAVRASAGELAQVAGAVAASA